MPEEERNRYYEQARQATLAQIAGSQQAMLESPVAEQLPAGRTIDVPPVMEAPTAPAVTEQQQKPVGFDAWFNNTWSEKAALQKQAEIKDILDPRVQRAENSRKWIAGIGDALASMANLIGTGNDAARQPQHYMLPGVNAAIEQDRARRNALYQKELDRKNALMMKELEERGKDARAAAQIGAQNDRAAADRAARQANNDIVNQLARDKFDADQQRQKTIDDLNERKQQETERHNRKQEGIAWARVSRMKDNRHAGGGDAGSDSRYSGSRGGGMKDAKTDYNAMLDEIAVRAGATDWADLTNRSKNDRSMRELFNKFDLGKDKAGNVKIEGMISSYAGNYAPEFHEYYFGKDGGSGKIDFAGFKAKKPASGSSTLSGIMNSQPKGKNKRNK